MLERRQESGRSVRGSQEALSALIEVLYMYVCIVVLLYVLACGVFITTIECTTYICLYICTYVYVCTNVRIYVCVYVRIYICTYVCMYACMYVCFIRIMCNKILGHASTHHCVA